MSATQTSLLAAAPGHGEAARVPPRSALEHDFPAAALSRIAESESWRKEVHRPATATHKWWAKRLGSVFRGILAAAVSESGDEALGLYSRGGELGNLRVLDPFAGSGTTLVETVKLGARPVALDINPVATLVQRQAVQAWDGERLGAAFAAVEGSCRAEIDRLHRNTAGETVLYYFWVATAACPDCAETVRLFSSQVFASHAYPRRHPAAQAVCPVCLELVATRYDFEQETCRNGHRFERRGAVAGASMTCANGHRSPVIAALGGGRPGHELYAKLVLGADAKKRYEPIDDFDRALYGEAEALLERRAGDLVGPGGRLEDGENTAQAIRWGFAEWRQFFNARQLHSLGLLGAAVAELDRGPEREALAALFSGTLEFNNLFCSFKGEGTGAVRHMFSHHVLKPERTPLEAHPWGTPASSGSFSTLFERRLARAAAYKHDPADQVETAEGVKRIRGISLPLERPIAETWEAFLAEPGSAYVAAANSAATDLPPGSIDLVITDPPYMDNVHYSELADFFHAWLRELEPFDSYPAGASTTRSAGEVQSPSPAGFERAIAAVWAECHRVLRDEGLVAFTFHQARLSGWVALVSALAAARLEITAVQPVKGEMSTSSTKHGREPSNLDSIVVARKRGQGSRERQSPAERAAAAELKLGALRAGGIGVGAGDVRSVVRGHVLAAFTCEPEDEDLAALAARADELAAACVERWADGD
jgi:putative DNA methylase